MIIKVHVSPDDKAMIERAAKTERRSVSSYVAVAAVEKARAFIPPVLTPEHEASLAAEYGQDAVARYYEGRDLRLRAVQAVQAREAKVTADVTQAAPAKVEKSCFTCAHDWVNVSGNHDCKLLFRDENHVKILSYIEKSGADDTDDNMPTNRSIRCPGWAAREPK